MYGGARCSSEREHISIRRTACNVRASIDGKFEGGEMNYKRGYVIMAIATAALAAVAVFFWGIWDFAKTPTTGVFVPTIPAGFAVTVGGVAVGLALIAAFAVAVRAIHRLAGWLGGDKGEKLV